jgi:hypothetical protein
VTPGEARAKRFERAKKIRSDEALCARDFLVWGDTRGKHASFCIFEEDPCSRTYNPWPSREAAPDPSLHEGTGIGALYDLRGSEHHLWQLAGWNLTTRRWEGSE